MKKSAKKLESVFNFSWGVERDILDLNKTSHTVIGIDSGGTKTLVAHVDRDILDAARKKTVGISELSAIEYYTNSEFGSLHAVIDNYLKKHNLDPSLAFLSVAAAGPVENDRILMSNYNWSVDKSEIQSRFHFLNVYLMNDLEAMVHAVERIDLSHLDTLNRATRRDFAPVAVISSGTGLGESIGVYVPEKASLLSIATEGGNSDFAPSTDLEIELYRYLKSKNGYVSWEDVASGKGIPNIFNFLQENGVPASAEIIEQLKGGNEAGVISDNGLSGRDGSCRKTLEIFAAILGSEAGNLALKSLPYGGLFVSGGIAPKIASILKEPFFMERFLNKGRLRPVLEKIPVYLVTNSGYGVIGAINFALKK